MSAESPKGLVRDIAAEWVVRINDPDATPAELEEWHAWLAESPQHREAYRSIEHAWHRASQIDPDHVPGARAMLSPAPGGERRSVPARQLLWTLAASLAALSIGAASWFLNSSDAYQTRTAEQRSILLDDGSKIELAAESRVLVGLSDTARDFKLERGEVYFEVAPDESRPFIVHIGAAQIRALGTAFNIERSATRTVVTVTEGKVSVTSAQRAGASAVVLGAGERGVIDESGIRPITSPTTPEAATAWRSGRLEYAGEALSEVIDDVNRYAKRKIEIDPTLQSMQFTGTVFLDHVDEWLVTLQGSFPVEVVDDGARRRLVPVSR